REAYPRARAAAERALQLDPTLGEPHVALSMCAQYFDHDLQAGLREAQRAVELGPNLAIAYHGLTLALNLLERHEEALEAIQKAVKLDPLTSLFQAHQGWVLHTLRRDEEAIRVLQAALEVFPNDYYVMRILLYAYSAAGRGELAIAT